MSCCNKPGAWEVATRVFRHFVISVFKVVIAPSDWLAMYALLGWLVLNFCTTGGAWWWFGVLVPTDVVLKLCVMCVYEYTTTCATRVCKYIRTNLFRYFAPAMGFDLVSDMPFLHTGVCIIKIEAE